MDPFSSFTQGFQNARKLKQDAQNNSIDALVKQAQLKELGYDMTPRKGGFFGGGGYDLTERPDFVSNKDLERQKLQSELDMVPFKRDEMIDKRDTRHSQKALYDMMSKQMGGDFSQQASQPPAKQFATPQEAEASGLPPGTIVTVSGRQYSIDGPKGA